MTSVSNSQVAKSFRANRHKSFQWLGRFVLSSLGWKVTGSIKEEHENQKLDDHHVKDQHMHFQQF